VSPKRRRCPGCDALVPEVDGPAHPYLGTSPGCWALYGEVLAKEYGDYTGYASIHRLTVDSYAAQHPGVPSSRSIQSVAVHLIRLHLLLERDLPPERANAAILWAVSGSQEFVWLTPPASPGGVTVLDVRRAGNPDEHVERVREWAKSVWEAWSAHHDTVRRWADSW
jgi:Family of unknown function (DUF5946)